MIAPGDLGTPTTASSYTMCLYDQGGLKLRATAPAGGVCGTKPCWKASHGGFKLAAKAATGDGLTKIILKPGEAGKAKISVRGKGANLHLPPLQLDTPVRVQLKRSDGNGCWEGTFSAPATNDSGAFSGKSD